ncbi:hypothetical protein LTR37_014720 [Vermiconidia calcicola]|uniref:Uncharacterized protein n=1 Tax=Vermiconidia calcicola TaxID=1690605 RepID=A0ACC3MSY3_9PEZI|nr:hypothetical protein LTR37_014720 [Vermiconidia calcicola]
MASTNSNAPHAEPQQPTQKDDAGNLVVPCFIEGKPVLQPSSSSFPVTSSKEDRILHHGQNATVPITHQAIDSAWKTFKSYRHTPVHQRRAMLLKAADLFEANAAEAVRRQMLETSCPLQWAQFNVMLTVSTIREVAAQVVTAVTGEMPPSYFGNTTLVYREAVGPVLLIPPWNAALVLSARSAANALAAGCTLIFKASELCPWTHELVVSTFHKAGFPPGAINMLMADRSKGPKITETIIAHPSIRKVEFIGSAAVGRIIGATAGKYLKPVLMELGDQSPAIVLADADLGLAARMCAQGTLAHQGQVCFSTERIIVMKEVKEEFEKELVKAVEGMVKMGQKGGSPASVTAGAAEKAKAGIDAAVKDGAKFLYGNSDMTGSASLSASILTNVDPKSLISTGESFAPTAFLMAVDTEEEAIEEANSRIGGLSASVFTSSYERGIRVARVLEFGGVQINNMTIFAEPTGPTTGFKGSGWGSTHGRYGIQEFLYNKSVSLTPTGTAGSH